MTKKSYRIPKKLVEMKGLIIEDAGWKTYNLRSGIRFLISVDDGTPSKIKSATLGLRINFKLRDTNKTKGATYPSAVAARMLRKEIEEFIKSRYDKVFQSTLYKIENFSRRNPAVGHSFAAGHEYDSSAAFKFGKTHVVDIYDQVTFNEPVHIDDLFDSLKKNAGTSILSDKLFKPQTSDPWTVSV